MSGRTFAGEVAVVCGATGALGRPIVAALGSLGLTVLAVARSPEGLDSLGSEHPEVEVLAADVRDPGLADAVAAAVGGRPVRCVVNAAAGPLTGDILTAELEAITAAVDVKVNGLVRLVRGVRDDLVEGSRVIAIGGSFGYDPSPSASSGGVANAGLANVVRQLARTLGPQGVTCHVVAPGPVVTARLTGLVEREAVERGVSADRVLRERATSTARGQLTTPDEVASAVVALLDGWAAASTGATWFLDGGARTATP